MTPFPYQYSLIDGVRTEFLKGNNWVVLCAPTGAGKTVMFTEIGKQVRAKGKRVIVLTDRLVLCDQVRSYGIDAMTAQGAWSQGVDLTQWDLVICDEAHEGIFTKLLERTPPRFVIGATATPVGNHMAKLYSAIVQTVTVPDLIDLGRLVPCVGYMREEATGLKSARGEYTEKSQMAFFDRRQVYDGVVEDWFAKEQGKRTLVYAVNIAHAERLRSAFGKVAHVVHSKSGDTEGTISAHKRGDFPVLINVGILTKGYDDPQVEVIMVCRATKSVALWHQMLGRGGRACDGKMSFRAYDYGGNFKAHGRWDAEIIWKIEAPKKKGEGAAPVRICPECSGVNNASAKVCECCGHVFEVKERVEPETVLVEVPLLRRKRVSEMTVDELIERENLGTFKRAYTWRVLSHRPKWEVERYAEKRGYKAGWILRTMKEKKDFYDKLC